jgi:hypothetical protein
MGKGRFGCFRAAAACAGVLALLGCESSERIAPEGATVTVAATPTTIVLGSGAECLSLLNVAECGTAQVIATVSSKIGVPLPDQDVRFSSTAGLLFTGTVSNPDPASNLPIRTDEFGNAVVNLITSTTTTVTARSGAASGMLTLNTVQGNLSRITLNVDTTSAGCTMSTTNVTSCSQTICFEAVAEDDTGAGIDGVLIVFALQNNTIGDNTFNGQFTPMQVTTANGGVARTTFAPDSTCAAECGMNKSCQAEVVASTQGGFQSVPVPLTINIP